MKANRFPNRRKFFTLIPATIASTHLTFSQEENLSEFSKRVIAQVTSREGINDFDSDHRRGGSAKIVEVMTQFEQVLDEHSSNLPPRLLALKWALDTYLEGDGQEEYAPYTKSEQKTGSVSLFPAESYKCNKFVADAYASGSKVGLSIGNDWEGAGTGKGYPAKRDGAYIWPPMANRLAALNENLRSLTNARNLRQPQEPKSAPELGDILAFPSDGIHGHSALYLGRDLIISAKGVGLEIGTVEYETKVHGDLARIRKFNGSGI